MAFGQLQPTAEIVPDNEQQAENLPVPIETEKLPPTPEQVEAFKEQNIAEISQETNLFANRGVEKFNNEILSLGFTNPEPILEEGKKLLTPFEEKAQQLALFFTEKLKKLGITGAIAGTILGSITGSAEQAQGQTPPGNGEVTKIYTDPEEYKNALQAYNDSLQLYEESMQELALEKARVKKNIEEYSPLSSATNVVTSLGNLFSTDGQGSGNLTPEYTELSRKPHENISERYMKSGKIKPTQVHEIGDWRFNTGYNFTGVESSESQQINSVFAKRNERFALTEKRMQALKDKNYELAQEILEKETKILQEEYALEKSKYSSYIATYKKPIIKPELVENSDTIPDQDLSQPAEKERPEFVINKMPPKSAELTSETPEALPEQVPDAQVDIMSDVEKFVPYSSSSDNPNIPLGYWEKGMGNKETQDNDTIENTKDAEEKPPENLPTSDK